MSHRIEFSAKVRDQAAQRAASKCQSCKCDPGKPVEFDHILPAALGGKATLANCQVLCGACHKEKPAKRRAAHSQSGSAEARREWVETPAARENQIARLRQNASASQDRKARIERATLPPRQIYEAMK